MTLVKENLLKFDFHRQIDCVDEYATLLLKGFVTVDFAITQM